MAQDNNQNQQEALINWSFADIETPERGKKWYFWTILIGIVLLLIAIFSSNFLFGLIIILIGVVLFAHHNKPTENVDFAIVEQGLIVGDRFFDFKDIKHFWIIYEPDYIKNLYFEFKNSLRPRLTIPLKDVNPVKVRKILLQFLVEDLERDSEPLSESIGKRLKL